MLLERAGSFLVRLLALPNGAKISWVVVWSTPELLTAIGKFRRFLSAPFRVGQGSLFLLDSARRILSPLASALPTPTSALPWAVSKVAPFPTTTGALRPSASPPGGSVPGPPLSTRPLCMSRVSPLAGTFVLSCGQLLILSTLRMGVTYLLPRTLCGAQHSC